jgi:hypothetical protein
MRMKLLMMLLFCIPSFVSAGNHKDNGYDDVAGLFEYCSGVNSPGVRYTYVSKLMMRRASSLPLDEFDLKPLSGKIDFVKSVYVAPPAGDVKECARRIETLPDVVDENGFVCVLSLNRDGNRTNMYVKSGDGGLNSVLMTLVAYNADGDIELAVAALIGGVFSHEEILSIMKF